MSDRPCLLLIEDSLEDADLLQRAFAQGGALHHIVHIQSVDDAIGYLTGEGPFHDRSEHPIPVMILLDLKLPGKDGFDFLHWLRSQPHLSEIFITVVSTYDLTQINRAYKQGADSYLLKPVDPHEVTNLLRFFEERGRV